MNVVLTAEDQLRQRVAWALSQIVVVCEANVARAAEQEFWHAWQDLFVRNAFMVRNYRTTPSFELCHIDVTPFLRVVLFAQQTYPAVMKEVSYSPAMGVMLTYLRSKSKDYDQTVLSHTLNRRSLPNSLFF